MQAAGVVTGVVVVGTVATVVVAIVVVEVAGREVVVMVVTVLVPDGIVQLSELVLLAETVPPEDNPKQV